MVWYPLAATLGATAWAMMTFVDSPTNGFCGVTALVRITLPLVALRYAAMIVDLVRRHRAGNGGAWKARTCRPVQRDGG